MMHVGIGQTAGPSSPDTAGASVLGSRRHGGVVLHGPGQWTGPAAAGEGTGKPSAWLYRGVPLLSPPIWPVADLPGHLDSQP